MAFKNQPNVGIYSIHGWYGIYWLVYRDPYFMAYGNTGWFILLMVQKSQTTTWDI